MMKRVLLRADPSSKESARLRIIWKKKSARCNELKAEIWINHNMHQYYKITNDKISSKWDNSNGELISVRKHNYKCKLEDGIY